MEHGARQHAKYSASNAHRFLRCAGQVALASTAPPRPDSKHSTEGTRAHELLQRSLLGEKVDKEATPEMLAAFEVVHDFLDSLYIARGPHLVVQVEQPFRFPQRIVRADDAAGIADLMVVDHMEQEAWSIDFKYGEGIAVEPERNAQLMFNAVGRLWRTPVRRVNLVVIQPRIPHHPKGVVRQWSCGPLELAEFQGEIEEAIAAAEAAEKAFWRRDKVPLPGTITPGPWCRWCPAEIVCSVRERNALALAFGQDVSQARDLEGRALPEPTDLGLDRVAHILRHADTLTTWLRAVENYAKQQAMSGVPIPGYKLVEAQPRRQWHGDAEQIAAKLIELSGYTLDEDHVRPRELIGITAAESKLVEIARERAAKGEKDKAARAMRDALAFLTLRQSSGNLVLVPEADSRPAINQAAAMFAGVNIPAVE